MRQEVVKFIDREWLFTWWSVFFACIMLPVESDCVVGVSVAVVSAAGSSTVSGAARVSSSIAADTVRSSSSVSCDVSVHPASSVGFGYMRASHVCLQVIWHCRFGNQEGHLACKKCHSSDPPQRFSWGNLGLGLISRLEKLGWSKVIWLCACECLRESQWAKKG